MSTGHRVTMIQGLQPVSISVSDASEEIERLKELLKDTGSAGLPSADYAGYDFVPNVIAPPPSSYTQIAVLIDIASGSPPSTGYYVVDPDITVGEQVRKIADIDPLP